MKRECRRRRESVGGMRIIMNKEDKKDVVIEGGEQE